MFERFTEKARRVIFFARYEASNYGSPNIEAEHLLLGLLREDRSLRRWTLNAQPETLRQQVDGFLTKCPPISTSIDLPLSEAGKRVLQYAADEAERLAHRWIGTEHLFLGLLGEEDCFAAKILRQSGADPATIRMELAGQPQTQTSWPPFRLEGGRLINRLEYDTVKLHGSHWRVSALQRAVKKCQEYNWHWHKRTWKGRDIVVDRKSGKVSFDVSLAEYTASFTFVKAGWTKDHCQVCRWELYESEDDHGTGFTNGRDWLCTECYAKFWEAGFFLSPYSDIT